MRVVLALGLRLGRPRKYLEWLQVLTVSFVVALSTLSGTAFVSARGIVDSQNEVSVARAPHQPNVIPPGRQLPKIATITDDWGGITVTRQVIVEGANGTAPRPPGVPRAPRPGEAFVSPAVWALRGSNQPAWLALRGKDVVGVIAEEGLLHPAEAQIVMGGDARSTRRAMLSQFDSFGDPTTPGLVSLRGNLVFLAAAALCLVIGGLLFAATLAVRLRESERARRNRLLSALGLGPVATRLVSCSELLVGALAGSAVGLAAFHLWWRRLDGVPGTDFRFWPASSAVSGVTQIAIAMASVVAIALLAAAQVKRDRRASTRMTRITSRPTVWNAAPLGASLLVMAVAVWAKAPLGDSAKVVALVGAGIALVAIPFAGRRAVFEVGNAWARRARTGGGLLGGRWTSRTDTAAFKVAQVVSVGLFAFSLSIPIVTNLRGDTTQAETDLASASGTNQLITGTTLTASEITSLPGNPSVMGVVEATEANGGSVTVLIATCRDLANAVKTENCGGSAQWINVYGGDLSGYIAGFAPPYSVAGDVIPVSPTSDRAVRAPISGDFQGAIRVDPSVWSPPDDLDQNYLVNIASGRTTQDRFEAALVAIAPTAALSNSFSDIIDQADALLPAIQFIQTSLAITLAALLLALAAAVLRSIQDTSHAERLIGSLGASKSTTSYARFLSQALPVLLQCLLAAIVAVVFWRVFANIDPFSAVPSSSVIVVLLTPIPIALLMGLIATPAPRPRRQLGAG